MLQATITTFLQLAKDQKYNDFVCQGKILLAKVYFYKVDFPNIQTELKECIELADKQII